VKDNRGVALVELLVVLGLIGIVLSLILLPIIFSYNSFEIQDERANIVSDARETMDYLTRQIRKTNHVEVVDDNTIIMDSIVYKLDNGIIYKGDTEVIKGIDELLIKTDENGRTISIEIAIKDSKGQYYRLSSNTNIRKEG
jgi:prepilin-type N-terminal cleavage/methylation domain-containing protein